jgi:hypothetical protein
MKTIQVRRDTAERWSRFNPLLSAGEPGFATDTGVLKIGDGFTPWNELASFVPAGTLPGGASDEAILQHIESELPHPVYDDGPSFVLFYENAKV